MILVDKNTNAVLAMGKSIDVADNFTVIDGTKYHELKATNSYSINTSIPYGKPTHWKYIDGELVLSASGTAYTEALAMVEMQKKAQELTDAVKKHLDDRAKYYRYDDIKSARSYAGFVNAFQAEATKLGQWASECWVYAGQVEQDVINGVRAMPTPEELVAELPPLVM